MTASVTSFRASGSLVLFVLTKPSWTHRGLQGSASELGIAALILLMKVLLWLKWELAFGVMKGELWSVWEIRTFSTWQGWLLLGKGINGPCGKHRRPEIFNYCFLHKGLVPLVYANIKNICPRGTITSSAFVSSQQPLPASSTGNFGSWNFTLINLFHGNLWRASLHSHLHAGRQAVYDFRNFS